jgi:hypothetical protein
MTDTDYFRERALDERIAALKAKTMASFSAHMAMCREYETRIFAALPRGFTSERLRSAM